MSSASEEVVLVLNVPIPEPPTLVAVPSFQDQLVKIVSGVLSKKPQSKADALALLHTLDSQLVPWLVSELPLNEQKAVLATVWAVKQVASVNCTSCLPK